MTGWVVSVGNPGSPRSTKTSIFSLHMLQKRAQGLCAFIRPFLLPCILLVLSITHERKWKLDLPRLKPLTLWALDRKHSSALISYSKLSA